MATVLNILMNITGEAIAENYKYEPNMTVSNIKSNQLYIPYAIRLTNEDLKKADNFDTQFPSNVNLISIFTDPKTLYRAIDYASTGSEKQVKTLQDSEKEGILQSNIELLTTELIFKRKNNIKLVGDIYTIYESSIKSIKINKATTRQVESVTVIVDLGIYQGEIKRQKLTCIRKRQKLRNSFREVFGIDLLGEPKKRDVVPKRLVTPIIPLKVKPSPPYPGFGRYPYSYPYPYPQQQQPYSGLEPLPYQTRPSQTKTGGKKHKRKQITRKIKAKTTSGSKQKRLQRQRRRQTHKKR